MKNVQSHTCDKSIQSPQNFVFIVNWKRIFYKNYGSSMLWTCFYLQPRVWITAQGQQWRWYSHAFSCYNTVFMVDFEQKFAHKNKEKLT